MDKSNSFIAYTVMMERHDGTLMFLVENEKNGGMFPGTHAVNKRSGLSTIIEEIKRAIRIDFERLELSELTNAVINDNRIPLFVFNYDCGECEPEDLLFPGSPLEWQTSEKFKGTLQQYEIKGVPLF